MKITPKNLTNTMLKVYATKTTGPDPMYCFEEVSPVLAKLYNKIPV